jgi:hypothetical protein
MDTKVMNNSLLLAEHKRLVASHQALKLVVEDLTKIVYSHLIGINDEPEKQRQTGVHVDSSFGNLAPLPSAINPLKNRQSTESLSHDELIQQYAKLCSLQDSHLATLIALHEKLTIEYNALYQFTKKLIADNLKLFISNDDRNQQLQTEPTQQVGSNHNESASSKRRRLI